MPPTVLLDELRWGDAAERFGAHHGGAVAVRVDPGAAGPDAGLIEAAASLPIVVVVVAGGPATELDPGWRALADVVLAHGDTGDADLDAIAGTVAAQPIASAALALLLRDSERRSVSAGLAAESAVYSTLQAGPEFAAWRATRPRHERGDEDQPRVRVDRDGGRLTLTLTRPAARNALDARMRDELHAALVAAAIDDGITAIDLRADGPAFCAGGDLDEFGTRADPASAHLLRLTRSVGRVIHAQRATTTAHLHGACVGSGIELPAFADTVLVAPDTQIALPEVALGLVPGAGGTVSLPARIGRHRTAWLALTGGTIDAETAVAWGLADGRA